jgi:hypothetical protein
MAPVLELELSPDGRQAVVGAEHGVDEVDLVFRRGPIRDRF